MNKNIFYILFITTTFLSKGVLANPLSRAWGFFFDEGPELINYCHRGNLNQKQEANAQCAEQICSKAKAPSVYLSPEGIEQRLANQQDQIDSEFGDVEDHLEEVLRGLEEAQRAYHLEANKRRETFINSIDELPVEDIGLLANKLLAPYVTNYRWENNSEKPFVYIPEDFPEEHKKSLNDYANSAWNKRDQYPTGIIPSDSLAEQRNKARNTINNVRKAILNDGSISKYKKEDLKRNLDYQIQLINSASGKELEEILIETDVILKRTFLLKNDYGIVNYENLNTCTNTQCKSLLKNLFKAELDKRVAAATKPSSDEIVANAMNNCRSRYASSILSDLSDKKAKELYSKVLKTYIDRGLKNFSEHTIGVFKQHANNQKIVAQDVTKQTGEQFVNYLEKRLPPPKNSAKDAGKFLGAGSNPVLVLSGSIKTISSEVFNVDTVCPIPVDAVGLNSFTPGAQLGGQGVFRVGQGVEHHFMHGKQAIARELTHVLVDSTKQGNWSQESFDMFKVLRGCAVQNYAPGHGNPNRGSGPYFENDLYTTNGDFADLMAYRTYPNESQLYGCGLFESVSNDRNSNNYHLINNDPSQTDSTPFMRLLQESIHKKIDLPKSCQRIIEQNRHRIGTRSCL